MKLKILLSIFILVLGARLAEGAVTIFDGVAPVSFNTPKWSKRPVTEIAAEMLSDDIKEVTGMAPAIVSIEDARIKIVNLPRRASRRMAMPRIWRESRK